MNDHPDPHILRVMYTPEEVEQMLHGPPMPSLSEILDELEREHGMSRRPKEPEQGETHSE
ncbi:MAG: hypothetical protein ABGY75_16375 [Gemmataceae bacterium]